jgi:myo-inositol-1(or 4)-monophosphatase
MSLSLDAEADIRWEDALQTAVDAAREAGAILRNMLDRVVAREKSANDLVTDADIAAQQAIESILMGRFPEHGFLGEEGGDGNARGAAEWQWVVDPLDGTTNYAHGLRNFCVSIALMHRDRAFLGVIFDPMADELYSAVRGRGAYLESIEDSENPRRTLEPSGCEALEKALVAVSFPPKLHRESQEIETFLEILLHAQSVRRLGSAALNLCYVATGRLDAYVGSKLNIWDIAAASLIAEEAGAALSPYDGGPFDPWRGQVVSAASYPLLSEVLQKIAPSKSQ